MGHGHCQTWRNRSRQLLAGGDAKRFDRLVRQVVVSYRTQHTFTMWLSNHLPWCLHKWVEKLFSKHKWKPARGYFSSFIVHSCPSLEATKMSFSAWRNKLWPIQMMKYYSVLNEVTCWRTDALELWCWRRLLRVPWTARRFNQSILKEINPEYSWEGLLRKLKFRYFGHLIQRNDS